MAVGDALGAKFEAQSAEFIRGRFSSVEQLVDSSADELWYTDDTQMAIGNAILLGGDTDTIAAMAGAISSAHLGDGAIPPALLNRLENSPKGRAYIAHLADRLCAVYLS